MGYSYDVALLIRKASRTVLDEELNKATEEIQEFFAENSYDHCFIDEVSNDILYIWTYNKLSSEEESFLDELISCIPNEDFRFIKVGENWNDIEVQGYHYTSNFGLELVREIKFTQPAKQETIK